MRRDILKPAISLFLICLVTAALLAVTNYVTKNIIKDRAQGEADSARKQVLAEAESFEAVENFKAILGDEDEFSRINDVYKAIKNGSVIGHVLTITGQGYGGDMEVIVGIDMQGKITGLKIGENSETAGLGSKVTEEAFTSQFVNLNPDEPLTVVKVNKSKPEEIEAVSGATVSSRAVTTAVQTALNAADKLSGEGE
ncbi:MAG TPA: RnfABCDGE type electron transport complex subunit G [Clostridiaceae bacterium]|jgi:electron transport complex protein RnfG|nr:RnfABCDGE type electron transport complex subunit G [Clostridiaceae bacterium]